MGVIIILFAMAVWVWRRVYDPQAPLTNTRSIAKNSVAPMGLNLFNRAIDFVFAAFYLRMLGPADAGAYATAIIIAAAGPPSAQQERRRLAQRRREGKVGDRGSAPHDAVQWAKCRSSTSNKRDCSKRR